MPRQKRDFGTIRRRSNGRYQAYYMGPDLAFHRAPSTFDAKADAEAWLAKERKLLQEDTWTPSRSRRAKVRRATEYFDEYANDWLEQRELKPRTRVLYRGLLNQLILPELGQMSLRDISPSVVRAWTSSLDPAKPTRRAHAYSLLRSILNTAVVDEILASNPCKVRGAGSAVRARRIEPVALDELAVCVEAMGERYRMLIVLAVWCGLRMGELTELRRRDLELPPGRGVVHVRRGVVRVEGQVVVGSPKSAAGVRDVTIPPHLLDALQRHLGAFVAPEPDALVFSSVNDPDVQVHPNTLYKQWYKARESAGRPDLRIHDLRHSGAVLAAQTGATLAELMARLGHSTPQAALRYQHAARGRDAEIAAALSRIAEGDR